MKTAVEWYAEQAMQLEIQRGKGIISISQMLNELSNIFQQAKEMEKEQIMKARQDIFHTGNLTNEEYYNETFKSE
jgi:2-oxo-4-hydroxy-4-carboxy--5-ureidoimidazoline (OHCU) decarboxylase